MSKSKSKNAPSKDVEKAVEPEEKDGLGGVTAPEETLGIIRESLIKNMPEVFQPYIDKIVILQGALYAACYTMARMKEDADPEEHADTLMKYYIDASRSVEQNRQEQARLAAIKEGANV